MANPANPVSVGTSSTPILSVPAREVAVYPAEAAAADVTLVVTYENGFVETAVLLAGGPGLVFKGPPPARAVAAIAGTVASGSQNVYRAVLQP
jgi:hypothetical protein